MTGCHVLKHSSSGSCQCKVSEKMYLNVTARSRNFPVNLIHSKSHLCHNVCNSDTDTRLDVFDVLITERCRLFGWVSMYSDY